jgi:hypothetical protein
VGFIVDSFGGNTSAGADFLKEAVKRLDLNAGAEEEEADANGHGHAGEDFDAGDHEGLGAEAEAEAIANAKRVADSDLDGPRAKAARTGIPSTLAPGGEDGSFDENSTAFMADDPLDENPFTVVLLVRRVVIDRGRLDLGD